MKRSLALLLALILGIFGCMAVAHGIQPDLGAVSVQNGYLSTEVGILTY